jgi:hypothetical protein
MFNRQAETMPAGSAALHQLEEGRRASSVNLLLRIVSSGLAIERLTSDTPPRRWSSRQVQARKRDLRGEAAGISRSSRMGMAAS